MRIPFCPRLVARHLSLQMVCRRRGSWRQTTGKRKRDKTWNDVAAAQKRGVESQGLSKRTRHQLVSTEKVSCGLARAELG